MAIQIGNVEWKYISAMWNCGAKGQRKVAYLNGQAESVGEWREKKAKADGQTDNPG